MEKVPRKQPSDRFVAAFLIVSVCLFGVAMVAMYGVPFTSETAAQEVEVEDAPGPLALNESGEVQLVAITHVSGDPIAIGHMVVYVGGPEGTEFGPKNRWRVSVGGIQFEVRMNDQRMGQTNTTTFESGDVIQLVKARGTTDHAESLDWRITAVNTRNEVTIIDTVVIVT